MSTTYPVKHGANIQNTLNAIARRQGFNEFNRSPLWGSHYPNGPARERVGLLPRPWAQEFLDLRPAIEYVVYSYSTPIAWYAEGKWTMPNTKYSPTTSNHQSTVHRALGWRDDIRTEIA